MKTDDKGRNVQRITVEMASRILAAQNKPLLRPAPVELDNGQAISRDDQGTFYLHTSNRAEGASTNERTQ